VIRGLGPTLMNFNLTGVLADPTLELYDAGGTLMFSDNDWKNTQQAAIHGRSRAVRIFACKPTLHGPVPSLGAASPSRGRPRLPYFLLLEHTLP
jgi:hypothetical protein